MDYNCNPAGKAATQVGRGPQRGNQSLGDKPAHFTAAKEAFKATCAEITRRYGERAQKTHVDKDDDSIHPNTKMQRGPTKGSN